jgi:L-2-hydroxyglutarate oxidase LhgO
MDEVEVVVIGAGVVGLAVARALALRGREVMVLEREAGIGMGTSSRNSEVIHAGIYYDTGSAKARHCVRGKQMLYDYCAERGVGHRRVGKLVVATTEAEVEGLRRLKAKGEANGVHDLRWMNGADARAMEPELRCVSAFHSPSSGIVDSHAFMLALQGDLEARGGMVVTHTEVRRIERAQGAGPARWVVHVATRTSPAPGSDPAAPTAGRSDDLAEDTTRLAARWVVNAAGLYAVPLARRIEGVDLTRLPRAHYAKGHYFSLARRSPFSRLVYPMPPAGGLGVHVTLDLAGQARFGPDVEWLPGIDDPDTIDYRVDVSRAASFEAEIRRYWPGLPDGALQPAYTGVRPKISGPGEPAGDFRLEGPKQHGQPGLLHLLGIESPGLTSSLSLALEASDVLLAE